MLRGVRLTLPNLTTSIPPRNRRLWDTWSTSPKMVSKRYAMRSLPATELDRLEEHLLICLACQDRLESTDEYVMAMHLAAGKTISNQ